MFFATFILFLNIKMNPQRFPQCFGSYAGSIIHGSEALPITLLFFDLLNVNSTRFVQLTGFRTNACFQLVDHIVVVQTVFAHAIFIEAAFLLPPVTPSVETSASPAIHHAADNRNVHRSDDIFRALLQRVNRTDNIKLLTRTGRTGDEVDPSRTDTKRFQNIETDFDLFDRIGRQ